MHQLKKDSVYSSKLLLPFIIKITNTSQHSISCYLSTSAQNVLTSPVITSEPIQQFPNLPWLSGAAPSWFQKFSSRWRYPFGAAPYHNIVTYNTYNIFIKILLSSGQKMSAIITLHQKLVFLPSQKKGGRYCEGHDQSCGTRGPFVKIYFYRFVIRPNHARCRPALPHNTLIKTRHSNHFLNFPILRIFFKVRVGVCISTSMWSSWIRIAVIIYRYRRRAFRGRVVGMTCVWRRCPPPSQVPRQIEGALYNLYRDNIWPSSLRIAATGQLNKSQHKHVSWTCSAS